MNTDLPVSLALYFGFSIIMMSKYDFIMFSRINLGIKKHNVLI
jgi:hypothetical protein